MSARLLAQPRMIQGRVEPTFPPILHDHFGPFPEAIFIERISSVNYIKQHIIEQRLECWDRCAFNDKKGCQGISACDTDGEDLAKGKDKPEVLGE